MNKIIEVFDLKKSFKDIQAVKGISFYVEEGKLFSFLGPNGAGKSTTIDMICTFLKPDAGKMIINGHVCGSEDDAIRSSIGVVFQDSLLDNLLTVKENLKIRGSFYKMNKASFDSAFDEAVRATGIEEFLNRPYGKLSGGQRRRADIARALINRPKILFLDEPTTGLDPQTRKNVWDLIRSLQRKNNMTVFLTTHYMEEAAASDFVVVIDHGEIVAKGTPMELKEKYATDCLRLSTDNREDVIEYLNQNHYSWSEIGGVLKITLTSTKDAFPILDACRSYIKNFEVIQGTMDDAFIGITGKEIRA